MPQTLLVEHEYPMLVSTKCRMHVCKQSLYSISLAYFMKVYADSCIYCVYTRTRSPEIIMCTQQLSSIMCHTVDKQVLDNSIQVVLL